MHGHKLFQTKLKSNKGVCQVKIILKIREKLGLVRPHPLTPLSNFFIFFLKHFET